MYFHSVCISNAEDGSPTLILQLALLQAQQVQAEADRKLVHLTNSLQQTQSQAAALSADKERLHAQLQQAAVAGPAVGDPVANVPQVSLAKYCVKHRGTLWPGCFWVQRPPVMTPNGVDFPFFYTGAVLGLMHQTVFEESQASCKSCSFLRGQILAPKCLNRQSAIMLFIKL